MAIQCWGYNSYGNLGDGTTKQRLKPVQVKGMTRGVTSISVGYYVTCAVQAGVAKCWGLNDNGQLGDGTRVAARHLPTKVAHLAPLAVELTLGSRHACALMKTPAPGDALVCWGENIAGELGIGVAGSADHRAPVKVVGMQSGVEAVDAGTSYTCAIQSGAAKCWGTNDSGQLGDASTKQRVRPVQVNRLAHGVKVITTGYGSTCAVTRARIVDCWGYGLGGELGDGATKNRPTPVRVHLI